MPQPLAYRRHLAACPHTSRTYTLCNCPLAVEYYDASGKRRRRSLGTTDWERGEHRAKLLVAGADWLPPAAPGISLAAATKRFLADCHGRHLAATTIDVYRLVLAHLAKFAGEHCALASIDLDLLSRYRQERAVMASTQRKEIEKLRTFFAWCEDQQLVSANPARKLRLPKTEDLVTLPLTRPEVGKLLDACGVIASDNPAETPYVRQRARALVLTLLYSGLRISDVTRLKRDALKQSGHLVLRTLKNGVDVKVLLHSDAVIALTKLPSVDPVYFFWSGEGLPLTATKNLRRTITRLGAIAGVHAHPHRFRDTFAVELLTNGADIRTVQQLLGHTSVRTTEKHYAHFVAAHQKLLDTAAATLDFSSAGKPVALKRNLHRYSS